MAPQEQYQNHRILNSDWYITNGGDGFESAVDPENQILFMLNPNMAVGSIRPIWEKK